MPVPLALAPAAAGIVAGISAFLASRGAWILAGLGVGLFTMKGMQLFIGYVVSDIQGAITVVQSTGALLSGASGAAGSPFGIIMLKLLAYCGFFDAINIVVGGYMTAAGLVAMRVVLRRLS